MRTYLLYLLIFSTYSILFAQENTQKTIEELNQRIDNAVIKKDVDQLRKLYADDFVFTHGSGVVDSKESWLKDIEKSTARFISRQHDSTTVEVHDNVAIITGRLMVTREGEKGISKYGIRYVRVYALRKKQWLLISHRTVKEWHY